MAEAANEFQAAVAARPDDASAYNNLGMVFARTGNTMQAIESYAKAIELRPNYAEALYNYGLVLEDMGRLADAARRYEQAIQSRRNYVDALIRFSILLSDPRTTSLRDLPRALDLARQAVRLTGSENPLALSAVANAYANVGEYREAAEAAQHGLEWRMRRETRRLPPDLDLSKKITCACETPANSRSLKLVSTLIHRGARSSCY